MAQDKGRPSVVANVLDSHHAAFSDISALAQKLGTAPVFVDADAQSTVPGGPLGGQTRVSLRNEHLSYLMTW